MGRLTTHVLDTTQGRPAVNLEVTLWALGNAGGERRLLKATRTNVDGRLDAPLLEGPACEPGRYELIFAVGAYFAAQGVAVSEPPFLDEIPIRFGIADPEGHYHVPLLVSPWAYSTYRGS
ncbi:MAG TPA: hydroxyisourate hydrolase [Chloroflexota bacterium]|nr:hydroxyisourate hydrolase [Chloroflexota bacterium]